LRTVITLVSVLAREMEERAGHVQAIVTYRHTRHISAYDRAKGIWNRWPLESMPLTGYKLILILRAIESQANELCPFNFEVHERWFRSCSMRSCFVGRQFPKIRNTVVPSSSAPR